MYHTVEITAKCPLCTYYELSKGAFRHFGRGFGAYIATLDYERIGLNRIEVRRVITPYDPDGYAKATLQLNPAKLLGHPRLNICTGRETEELYTAFAEIVPQIFPRFPADLDKWRLQRIDYAYDIFLENLSTDTTLLSWLYCELLSKGRTPFRYKELTGGAGGSLYAGKDTKRRSRITTINIYSKLPQIAPKFSETPDEALCMYSRAKRLLRCEIQCYDSKLANYTKNHKELIHNRCLKTWAVPEISEHIVQGTIKQIEIDAPYHTLKKAKAAVERTAMQRRRKDRLEDLMTSISKGATLQAYYAKSPEQCRRDMKWFRDNQVNPVTIPAKHGVEQLDSVSCLLRNAISREYPRVSGTG